MNYLGFLFEIDKKEKVIFIENKKSKQNIVIGFKSKLNLKNSSFIFLNKYLSFEPFLSFEKSNYYYGKISLSKETFVDFENLTIWFSSKKYREIRQLFEEEIKTEEDLIKRIINLTPYFN